MKRSMTMVLVVLAALFFFAGIALAAGEADKGMSKKGKMETATGKVTAIDSEGKGITIDTKTAKGMMDVGTIVDQETVVKVGGKKASLSDIKVGDTVTIRYLRSTDLFAKGIRKK